MSVLQKIWQRYDHQHPIAAGMTAILFSWQLVHLYWLTTAVVIPRVTGIPFFNPGPAFEFLLIIVDYTEIPALLTASLFYLHRLQKKFTFTPLLFLLLINSQWLHLFWITDEFAIDRFTNPVGLPVWLAWCAIFIDYLEFPVIFDTLRHALRSVQRKKIAVN